MEFVSSIIVYILPIHNSAKSAAPAKKQGQHIHDGSPYNNQGQAIHWKKRESKK